MLYVFPDPRVSVKSLLEAGRPTYWPGAVVATTFPAKSSAEKLGVSWPLPAAGWIQHDWDGTTLQQANRQGCTVRVTAWKPAGKVSEAIDLAQKALAYLLDSGSASVWRFTPGAGPLPGTDDDTGFTFCTFTVTAETRPTAVA